MSISPVTFAVSAPIKAIDRVGRVRRRAKSALDEDNHGDALAAPASEPMHAAASPEELASDETRDALLNIRLGG